MNDFILSRVKIISAGAVLFALMSCGSGIHEKFELIQAHERFINHLINNDSSFYSIVYTNGSKQKMNLAVGIFDSGIGGLTVFDAIITADYFDASGENSADGIADFKHEQFIYLADQANMPYSNYVEEGKKELLVEHVLKDALFLLNNKYHHSNKSPEIAHDKPQVKAIVIACNTATAYGKSQVEELCRLVAPDVKVIGVIDAGCKGALEVLEKGENATVAILATPATVGSKAYVQTLNKLKKDEHGLLNIIQQGGKGLHESIDNKPEFMNTNATRPYPEYQNPSLSHGQYKIERELLPYYNFDTTRFQLLYNKESVFQSDTIQINSVDNYTRYHIVSLIEKLKKNQDTIPLKAIVLGCTHYPYVTQNIHQVIGELRKTERYGHLLADSIHLIDPAVNTAKELYRHLAEQKLFNGPSENRVDKSQFFLSVPNSFEPDVETGTDGRFTYDYQYRKRNINELKDYTLVVPFSRNRISEEQLDMVQNRLPATHNLLNTYLKLKRNEP